MDPITALGMLASLSSLIRASISLLEVLKNFKDGDKEILDLFNDVSVFAEALKGFDRVLRSRQTNHKISTTVISKALEDASRTIQELERKLVHLSKFESTAMRRMKWVQHKSSLTKLHDRVKEQSTMLQSFLTLAHAYVAPFLPRILLLTIHIERHSSVHASSIPISSRFDRFRRTRYIAMQCPLHRRIRYSRLRHQPFLNDGNLWIRLLLPLEALVHCCRRYHPILQRNQG